MIPFVCYLDAGYGDYAKGIIMDTSLENAEKRFRGMIEKAGWFNPYIEVKMAEFDEDGYCLIEDHC